MYNELPAGEGVAADLPSVALIPGEIELLDMPYPHVAIADALTNYEGLERDFPAEHRLGRRIRMHGDLTYPDPEYEKLLGESPAYAALHAWVYSEAFIRRFLEIFAPAIETCVARGELFFDPRTLPIRPEPYEGREMLNHKKIGKGQAFLFPRLDIGAGGLGYGKVNGGRGVHVDNLTRLISILVYIDHNPTMVGGEHRLYRLEGYDPILTTTYAPQPNLMVASLQSNLALHDVNPVTAITGVRKAMYMAVSCSNEIWVPHRDRRIQKLTSNRYQPPLLKRAVNKLKRKLKLPTA